MAQHPTNPIPETLESVPGYPEHLKIYRIPASSYWYVRGSFNDKRVTRSLKTENHANAISAAKDFYKEMLVKMATNQPLTQGSSFKKAADALLEEDRGRVARGERKQSLVDDCEYILEKDLLPFFKSIQVKDINYKRIQEYVDHLRKRNVSSQTIKNHFIHLRKILKQAWKLELIDRLPIFPTVTAIDNPREWFTEEQYSALLGAVRKAIRDKVVVRHVPITEELMHLTQFMVNTFLRTPDIKVLQNKHIAVLKKGNRQYLRIMAKSKTKMAPVISTAAAVTLYEEHLKGDPEAYVFFNQYKRAHAMSVMAKQFKYVLEQTGLYRGENAERTLYSLRHTAIMRQLLHGDWSIHMIARNCRTSVEMIERFYGSHLQAEMNVAGMAQQNDGGATIEDFFE